ncbi:MAG: hypothetical protein ACYS1A_07555 [Planctomycetota bacterium]|jgi:hypothetical protein
MLKKKANSPEENSGGFAKSYAILQVRCLKEELQLFAIPIEIEVQYCC